MIPPRKSLPKDAVEWGVVQVDFSRLPPGLASSCPFSNSQIFDYVASESSDGDRARMERLSFVRDAIIEEGYYWLWRYFEEDGCECYVTVSLRGLQKLKLI